MGMFIDCEDASLVMRTSLLVPVGAAVNGLLAEWAIRALAVVDPGCVVSCLFLRLALAFLLPWLENIKILNAFISDCDMFVSFLF